MTTTRRQFLGQSGMTLAGAAFVSGPVLAGVSPMNLPIGFQAYEIIQDLNKDWMGTLKKMSGFGYTFIDMVVTGPYAARTARELKASLDAAGLGCDNCHWGYANFNNSFGPTMTYSQALGVTSVVCGPGPRRKTTDDWKFMAAELNRFGAMTAREGMFIAYHNHEIEFQKTPEGDIPYDVLMANTDPKLVRFQIDVGNLTFGGGDAYAYLAKYPTRYFSIHAKDFQPGKAAVPVGSGVLDWTKIFTLAKQAGIRSIVSEVGAYNASSLQGVTLEPPTLDVIELFRLSYVYLNDFKGV
jgi:sugar phosphate isomerase/epimerase